MIFITPNRLPTQLIDAQCALQIQDNTIVADLAGNVDILDVVKSWF